MSNFVFDVISNEKLNRHRRISLYSVFLRQTEID